MVAPGSESDRMTKALESNGAEGACDGDGDTPGGSASLSTTIYRRGGRGGGRVCKWRGGPPCEGDLTLNVSGLFPGVATAVGARDGTIVELLRIALPCIVGDAELPLEGGPGAPPGDLDEVCDLVGSGLGGGDGSIVSDGNAEVCSAPMTRIAPSKRRERPAIVRI